MKLPVEIFLCYSDVLLNRLKQETSFKDKQLSKRDHYRVWTYKPEGSEKPIFETLFLQQTHDIKYFYRKVLDCEKGKYQYGHIDNNLFLKTASFIGLQYPATIDEKKLDNLTELKCQILLQVFLMEYMLEYWSIYKRNYKVFEEKTGEMISNSQAIQEKLINEEAEKANNAILEYFDAVSSHDYEAAWELLDQNMQERNWQGSFDSFKKGYINTIKLSQIHIWDFSPSAKSVSCKVFYMDKVALHHSVDQIILAKMTLGEIDQFSDLVKKLLTKADENSMPGLRNLELLKVQEKTFAEYARYKCHISPETLEKIFPIKESESIARLYEVVCSKNGHGYKIRSITPIKGTNLR